MDKHEHVWSPYQKKDNSDSEIVLLLTGDQCNCGAVRQYNGPMYGYSITEKEKE